jgi:hypothetical protein
VTELTEITAWFAAWWSGVLTIGFFKGLIPSWHLLVGMGIVLSLYGAHNLFNDKFKDAP